MNAGALIPQNDGVRLPNGTRQLDRPHASRGGRPYPKEVREMVLAIWQQGGYEALNTPHYNGLRANHKFPHMDTCKRWIDLYQSAGHVLPKRDTGNHESQREINGVDLVNLALFRIVRPKAYIDEVRAYINNRNPTQRPYSRSQVVRAEHRLGLWLKVGSTTSNEAYRPANVERRRAYWAEDYPVGMNDQDTSSVICIDEAGFKLESQDRHRGKATKQRRVDARGAFKKGGKNANLLMGISVDFEYHETYTEGRTDQYRFCQYMENFIE